MRPGQMLPRHITTLSGTFVYERLSYQCRVCRASHSPLDAELGLMAGTRFTTRVRRAITFEGANRSFLGASAAIEEHHGLKVGHSQLHAIAKQEGRRIGAITAAREEAWRTGELAPEGEPEAVVLLTDATAVLTRSGEEHKMVSVVRGYQFDGPGEKEEGGKERPAIATSRYAATAAEQAAAGGAKSELASLILAVGERIGARRAKRLIFMSDGCEAHWDICNELHPGAIQIQDFWHVVEYLSGAAKACGRTPQEAGELLEKWSGELRESRMDSILTALTERRKQLRSQEKRETVRRAINYLTAGRERMDYARFRREGLPIGSGPIEAACKKLVKERFDVTGARWLRGQIGDILALRVAHLNQDWDNCWPKQAAG